MSHGQTTVHGTWKFLVVDDHAGFRQTLRSFLPEGLVTECADGLEALVCYESERPDWVLMDIEMPGMDGLTATQNLKQRFPNARVIIVTNHPDDDLRAEAVKVGACGFLPKEKLSDLPALLRGVDDNLTQP